MLQKFPVLLQKCPFLRYKSAHSYGSLSLSHQKAESSVINIIDPKKSPVSKIGECFQRKLENLRNYYAFKNFRLSTFPKRGQLNKRSKQLEDHQR